MKKRYKKEKKVSLMRIGKSLMWLYGSQPGVRTMSRQFKDLRQKKIEIDSFISTCLGLFNAKKLEN